MWNSGFLLLTSLLLTSLVLSPPYRDNFSIESSLKLPMFSSLKLIDQIEEYSPIEIDSREHEIQILNIILPLQATALHLNLEERSFLDEKVNKLYRRILLRNDYDICQRTSEGHSPSYLLIEKRTQKPFAILKQSNPEFFSSFKKHLPELVISAPVWEHELIGYEQDLLFGLHHTPITMAVRFLNEKNESVRGTIQEFISNAKSGFNFYNPEGADLLKALSKNEVHLVAISGMFKGLSAAHFNNYMIEASRDNPEKSKIYEVDLEEMLLPYNRLPEQEMMACMKQIDQRIIKLEQDEESNRAEIAQCEQEKMMMRRSLILCRLWILGLPQSALPFDRATLLMIAAPSLIPLLEQYQQEASLYSTISKDSWNAQLERVKIMQELAYEELAKETPTLSPRDFYFKIFGGEHLWAIAQQKKYPAVIAFNNLISDPYQHIVKDFGNPANIPECTRLDKAKDASWEAEQFLIFLRKMEEL